MTDELEETSPDIDGRSDSQGSINQILSNLLEDANGLQEFSFTGMQDVWQEPSPQMGANPLPQRAGIINQEALLTPATGETSEENPFFVKSEDVTESRSPDSGYEFVPSNDPQRIDDASIPSIRQAAAHPPTFNTARSNFPGDCGFHAVFDQQDRVPKNVSYTFSPILNKLFAKMNATICMQFKCQHYVPPSAIIRAMLLFQKPEDMCENVVRCQTHLFRANASPIAHHVLQIQDSSSSRMREPMYDSSEGRFNVSVPFDTTLNAGEVFVVPYVFTCLSTCIGGINRRPLLAAFTLEDGQGKTLGKLVMEVKICSCPGRDRPKEEERKRRLEAPETRRQNRIPLPRKRHREENAGQGYKFLRVKEENYQILSQINDALNLASLATDQQKVQYQEEEQSNNWKELLAKFCRDNQL